MRLRQMVWTLGLVVLFVRGGWAESDRQAVEASPTAEPPRFTLLQFSDVHVGHDLNRPVHKRLAAAVELANALKPSFVINTGDMTTHPVYEASKEHLAEFAECKRYVAPLTMPLYNLPGNHDIGYFDAGKEVCSGGEPRADGRQLAAWYCHRMGPLDQAFTVGSVDFVLLNNNPPRSKSPGYLSADQFQWIEDHLKTSRRAFIYCPVQLLENGTGAPWGDSASRLVELCRQYRVSAVAYGHQHQAHVQTVEGTQYIMCPDLKQPGHQAIYQYRIFNEHFDLWQYDVFSRSGTLVGAYRTPANGSRKAQEPPPFHPAERPTTSLRGARPLRSMLPAHGSGATRGT